MRIAKNLVLAGVAALALADGAALALAQSVPTMMVWPPDRGLAQIPYAGNVPPWAAFAPAPLAADYYGPASTFAMLDRISAQMERDMDALMADVAMAPPFVSPRSMFNFDMRNLPPGAAQYSFVSTMAGDGSYCMRSMEITRASSGARPRVVTHTSGDCRGVGDAGFGAPPLAPPDRAAPSIETRAWPGGQPSGPMLMNVAYPPAW
jgi:hypothetical protein